MEVLSNLIWQNSQPDSTCFDIHPGKPVWCSPIIRRNIRWYLFYVLTVNAARGTNVDVFLCWCHPLLGIKDNSLALCVAVDLFGGKKIPHIVLSLSHWKTNKAVCVQRVSRFSSRGGAFALVCWILFLTCNRNKCFITIKLKRMDQTHRLNFIKPHKENSNLFVISFYFGFVYRAHRLSKMKERKHNIWMCVKIWALQGLIHCRR